MSSVGEVKLRMSTGIYTGTCHFFLVESSHRELMVAGPAATATIRLEDEAEAGEVLVSPATAAAVGPEWLAGERGGAALLVLDREPDAAAPPVAEDSDRAGRVRGPRAVRSRRASLPPPARGRRGGAPPGHGRLPEVHRGRGAARAGRPSGSRASRSPRSARSWATRRRSLGVDLARVGHRRRRRQDLPGRRRSVEHGGRRGADAAGAARDPRRATPR